MAPFFLPLLPYLEQTDGGGGDDDIEVMDDDVVFVKDDSTPASTPAAAASAAEAEVAGGEPVAGAAVAGGGEDRPTEKTSGKENDVVCVSSAKDGVSKKRPASASFGESGDDGEPNGEAGVGSSSTNGNGGTAPKRAKG